MSEPIRPAEGTPDAGTGPDTIPLERRAVLRVAGVAGVVGVVGAGLAACSSSSDNSAGSTAGGASGAAAAPSDTSMAPDPSMASGGASASSGGSGSGSGTELGAASQVPVGGGAIFANQMVVVTQPTAGTYKAFGTTCTHAGCQVSKVSGGTIDCPCHGSKYSITDGSVQAGPAPQPLQSKNVTVQGGQIYVSS